MKSSLSEPSKALQKLRYVPLMFDRIKTGSMVVVSGAVVTFVPLVAFNQARYSSVSFNVEGKTEGAAEINATWS